MLAFPSILWSSHNQSVTIVTIVTTYITKEFKISVNPGSLPGILVIPLTLFFFIFINNFFGLFPFIFTASTHLRITIRLAAPLWIGHTILRIVKTPQLVLCHLVPLGTPLLLAPFMVIIEIVRNIIRPLALAVRLAANIIAGHLLLTLLANHSVNRRFSTLVVVLNLLIALCVLESAVRIIQRFVFRILSTLYINEVNSPKIS